MTAAQPLIDSYRVSATVLWGVQLAMTGAFAIAMAGLALRLARPVMQTLAMLWGLRAGALAVTLAYWLVDARNSLVSFIIAAGLGALYAMMIPVGRALARCAGDPPVTRPTVRWKAATIAGAGYGLIAHGVNVLLLDQSEAFSALWSRGLVFVVYLWLLMDVVGWWQHRPDSRHRVRPLLYGTIALLAFNVVDAYMRARGLLGTAGTLDLPIAILNALTGTLLFGVASVLTALESERDAIAVNGERLRAASLRAIEAERLQSLGSLAGGVAHDFNNVLGVILGGVDLASSDLAHDPASVREELGGVRAAATRGAALTHRLLAFARRRPDAPCAFSPADTLHGLAPMLARLMHRGVRLATDITAQATVVMDPTQFEQIVMNLVINARDAMPTGGTLTIELSDEQSAHSRTLALGGVTPGPWIRLTVRDEGTGIPAAIMGALFDPFFTTKGASGTGLGLATVANAVSEVGGGVEVRSIEGQGTQFDVWIPAQGTHT